MKSTVKTLVLITACFTGVWDVPGAAAQPAVRIRLMDAHSGKPIVGREVELFGTNVTSGLKARDTLFQLQSETQVDGVAHFRITGPLPNRLLFYSAQANGCGPQGFNSFVTTEVLRSGVVVPNTCADKRRKFDWREVTAYPGEIVIFVVEPRGP